MRPIRRFLLVALFFCKFVFASDAPAPDFTVKKVGEGVYAAITRDGGKSGSNAGFVVGDDGVAVIDTFVDVGPAQQLLAEIRKVSSLPIRFVINTHYHLDHTGGNKVFADAGATVMAHHNLRGWLRTENLKFFGQNIKPEQKARVDALVLPQLTYDDGVDLFLGSRRLNVRFMAGHTGGDSVVLVPDANVLFAGDLFWKTHLPNLIDASTEIWMQTLEKLQSDHAGATFIPGHGDVGNASDLRDFHDYISTLRRAVAQAQQAGKTGEELVNTILPDLKTKYGNWGFFDHFAPLNIQQTAAELKGQKRVPIPENAKGK
jgi:cyclase